MAARALEALFRQKLEGAARKGIRDPLNVLTVIAAIYAGLTLISLVSGASLLTGWASLVGNQLVGDKAMAVVANAPKVTMGFFIGTLVLWALVALARWRRKGGLSQ